MLNRDFGRSNLKCSRAREFVVPDHLPDAHKNCFFSTMGAGDSEFSLDGYRLRKESSFFFNLIYKGSGS